jgi:mono/diheme cytochrome c family protein
MTTSRSGLDRAKPARTPFAVLSILGLLVFGPSLARAQTAPAASVAAPASAAPAAASAAPAAGGAEDVSPTALLFGKKCGGCHTLGDGDRTGPDLVGVTKRRDKKWIATFLENPGGVIDSGDPVANELVTKFKGVRMPEQNLSPAELEAMIAYLEECTAKGGCKIATGKLKKASEATPSEVAMGRELFEGTRTLTNNGAPCISCHNVRGIGPLGGGTLAKDLTFVFARLGDSGLSSALATTPFPLMKDIFTKKPLTPSEQYQLKAFFYSVHRDGTPPETDHNFLYVGFLGLGASLGLLGAAWSGRMRRGIRQRIVHPTRGERGEP